MSVEATLSAVRSDRLSAIMKDESKYGRLSWRPLSCQRYDGRCGALILPACQMVLDTIGDLLADRRQLKQVFFDDRIVRLLGKFPVGGRLAP